MIRSVRAEWTKMRTMPSSGWLIFAALGVTVAVSAVVTAAADVRHCPTPTTCFEDLTKLSLTGTRAGQVVIMVLATLAITNEYGSRLIQTTLTATPRRAVVFFSKSIVVAGVSLAAGAAGALGAILVGRFILPGNGFSLANGYPPLSLAHGPTLRAAAGSALYLALVALLSIGVGAVVRDSAAAITAVTAGLFLSPMLSMFVSNPTWQSRLQRYSPMNAGLAIQATQDLARLPISPWAGLGVLAAYAVAAAAGGALMLHLRDA